MWEEFGDVLEKDFASASRMVLTIGKASSLSFFSSLLHSRAEKGRTETDNPVCTVDVPVGAVRHTQSISCISSAVLFIFNFELTYESTQLNMSPFSAG